MQGDDPESSALKGEVNEIAPADSNGLGDCPCLIGRKATLCGIHLKVPMGGATVLEFL